MILIVIGFYSPAWLSSVVDGSLGEEYATDRATLGPDEVSVRAKIPYRSEALSGELD